MAFFSMIVIVIMFMYLFASFLAEKVRIHERIMHTEYKKFKCSHCTKRFHTEEEMKAHEGSHWSASPYTCGDCGKVCISYWDLQQHKQVHSNRKLPYVCDVCGHAFAKNAARKRHMKCHAEDKPFKCSVCHRGFKVAKNLEVHMRSHTGRGLVACEKCGKTSVQRFNLKNHRCVRPPDDVVQQQHHHQQQQQQQQDLVQAQQLTLTLPLALSVQSSLVQS